MHKQRQLKLFLLYLLDKKPRDPLRPVVCRFYITPFDVELTRAVSHAYLAFSGLGKWYWSFNNVNWRGLMKGRWTALTHSDLIHYRRAVKLFTVIEVTTTLIWWDEKMAYVEQRITQGDKVSAIVYSRGTFFAGKERISPRLGAVGLPVVPPMAKPGIIDIWSATDSYVHQVLSQAASST